ncbi:hypothetical protein B0H66DRAFT_531065 [Apodospora peruviana]|uniref:C2H2-type domain-containing protein n=1 Tax=Apodospora peruviana TaxID=516989 RepID=A0AAE0ICD5_9PEZI|nr:hypothetical protein B0H66DRAFT_531065 [Apodospora peruviana]
MASQDSRHSQDSYPNPHLELDSGGRQQDHNADNARLNLHKENAGDRYYPPSRLSISSSTNRSSTISSIFSGPRSSIASTLLSRHSSTRSSTDSDPPLNPDGSPGRPEKRKDDLGPVRWVWCTFCGAAFETSPECKLHELESHQKETQHVCIECHAVYPRASLLAIHCQDVHRLQRHPSKAPEAIPNSTEGRSKSCGCGFCAACRPSQLDYLDHIGQHHDERKDRSQFWHNFAPGVDNSSKIGSPRASDTTSTCPPLNKSGSVPSTYALPPPVSDRMLDNTPPPKIFVKVKGNGPGLPSMSLPEASESCNPRDSSTHVPTRRCVLRRIDSDRNFAISKTLAVLGPVETQEAGFSSGTRLMGRDALVSPISSVKSIPRHSSTPRLEPLSELTSESTTDRFTVTDANDSSSFMSHSNSSVLSARTVDNSVSDDDSTSELSEPDIWQGFDGKSIACKKWCRVYQQAVDKIMEQLWLQYNRDWDALVTGYARGAGGNHSRRSEPSSRAHKSTTSHHAARKGHRHHSRISPEDDEDDGDEGHGYPHSPTPPKPTSAGLKSFACPFRKHSPGVYNLQDHQVCAVNTWPTIPRLKFVSSSPCSSDLRSHNFNREHLYRRHYKIHCQRCKKTFSDVQNLAMHEMSFDGCTVLDISHPGDISTFQEKQLKSRKHPGRHQTPEDKWREIYRLLFPKDEKMPSPYPEYAEDLDHVLPESRNSFSLQHYLLREMPTFFRQAAEEYVGSHIQPQEGLVMESIPSIIQDALHKAFDAYETSETTSGRGESLLTTLTPGSSNPTTTDESTVVPSSSAQPMASWLYGIIPGSTNDWLPQTAAETGSFVTYDPYLNPLSEPNHPNFGSVLPTMPNRSAPYNSLGPAMNGGMVGNQGFLEEELFPFG